ncbi:hypothetical protein RR46_08087 [Papilio xuthus]|uniref:Uncharacterized protein n=1 Tax=Papilio xuthus TaxID=66420 RepID=A0A194QBC3_PAPXU|nr:hypothetical protein RR46_08087 [Papilio xuthus]
MQSSLAQGMFLAGGRGAYAGAALQGPLAYLEKTATNIGGHGGVGRWAQVTRPRAGQGPRSGQRPRSWRVPRIRGKHDAPIAPTSPGDSARDLRPNRPGRLLAVFSRTRSKSAVPEGP